MAHRRTCVICCNSMYSSSYLCENCKEYTKYTNEVWFKELVTLQSRQDYLDKKEYSGFGKDINLDEQKEIIVLPQGRPAKTKQKDLNTILEVYRENKPISFRKLANLLQSHNIDINKDTVRKIILKHFK